MRGTVQESGPPAWQRRFIPADAGNGLFISHIRPIPAVYPRGCGERMQKLAKSISDGGLSPRMRGTGVFCTVRQSILPVYPRGCGEREGWATALYVAPGLSPRMRGT